MTGPWDLECRWTMTHILKHFGAYTHSFDDETRVFGLQTEAMGPGRSDVFLRYKFGSEGSIGRPLVVREMTACYRFRLAQYREAGSMFLSYAYSDTMDNALLFFQIFDTLDFYYNDVKESARLRLQVDDTLGRWHHHCFVFAHPSFRVYIDGEVAAEGRMEGRRAEVPLNGSLYVGQDQDVYDGGLDASQSLSAHMAQVNIWDHAVSPATVSRVARCQDNPRGNILSFDTDDSVEAANVTVEAAHISTFCTRVPDFVIVPRVSTLEEARTFCGLTNASLFIPEDEESNKKLFSQSRMFLDTCGARSYRLLFLDASDDATEDRWVVGSSGRPLVFQNWAPGEPNGGRKGNCVVMRKSDGKWFDTLCSERYCFACLRTPHNYLLLRGLCEPREDTLRLYLTGYINEQPYFRGLYKFMIYFSNGSWLLRDTGEDAILASFTPIENEYPLGRRRWEVLSKFCHHPIGSFVSLGLSSCTNYHFMCSDGSCVARSVRCNLQDDCADGSDEDNCSIIEFGDKYFNYRPPPSGTFGQPLPVEPLVDLVRFSKIDDINLAFNIEIEVTLAWRDRNLNFRNVRSEEGKNRLSKSQVLEVWTPEVEFLNIYDGRQQDLKLSVVVRENRPADPPLFNDVRMDTVHSPLNVQLVKRQQYSASFSCNFLLFNYPFDTQNCSILLRLASADRDVVVFQNATAIYRGMRNLHKFIILHEEATLLNDTHYSVIKVEFQLERRYSLLVLTIFVPTFLLILVGYTTLYIQLPAFQVRSIMSLTTMLVMYTLFSQVSNDLPDTAYIKMLDTWFFFCIFLILSIIFLHVTVEHLPEGNADKSSSSSSSPQPRSRHSAHFTTSVIKVRPRLMSSVPSPSPSPPRSCQARWTARWVMFMARTVVYPAIIIIFNAIFWGIIVFIYD
ncbi:uncharacterized protein LOC127006593 isoform X2 [Eriocheir sinensis]|uniref:uncharacterized protein LOC127006593 isoform X2 n=1 Tax=Eriocheir sinensis TaxID=95602 RepID=UPI0021C8C1A2|nr:uncharacterized protein LOC127006593 isoform X2 [Eriocheir sinensis]